MATPDVVLGRAKRARCTATPTWPCPSARVRRWTRVTERLRADGHRVLSGPRTTGDGYYESVVADPDGNPVEITE